MLNLNRMELTEKKLKDILKTQRLEYQRHLDVVMENVESEIKLIAESIGGVQEQLIALREMVARNTEDIEILKANMEVVKSDLQIIKQNLKRKVDAEEFETLEKRVLFLEKKLAS